MNKIPVIIEAIGYLLCRLKKADKIKLVKLMYLADKYHVMNYGRTISGDTFCAVKHGPIGSQTMDVLEFDTLVLGDYSNKAKTLFKHGRGHSFLLAKACNPESFTMLADSDIEALDFVLDNFGKMNQWVIVRYTHELKEWKQFKLLFDSNKTKHETIKTEELLQPVNDKYYNISEEHLKESLEVLTGTFD